MSLDFRNDDTIRYLLQGNIKRAVPLIIQTIEQQGTLPTKQDVERIREEAQRLSTWIAENGATIETSVGELQHEMQIQQETTSDLGERVETITTQIDANAENITEAFNRTEAITNGMNQYIESVDGEIRRGFITVNGERVFGIAISQKLVFDASVEPVEECGELYYALDGGQTFGFYTSTGWQFWIDGQRVGYFDSATSNLVTGSQNIQNQLQLGKWLFIPQPSDTDNGFGIKFLGG